MFESINITLKCGYIYKKAYYFGSYFGFKDIISESAFPQTEACK